MAYVAESAEVNVKTTISMLVLIGEFTLTPLVEIRALFALTLAFTRAIDAHSPSCCFVSASDEDVADAPFLRLVVGGPAVPLGGRLADAIRVLFLRPVTTALESPSQKDAEV